MKQTKKHTSLPQRWECFRDPGYYDQWAVRPVGETRWGYCFHVPSREEAEGLRDVLNQQAAPAAARGTHALVEQLVEALEFYGNPGVYEIRTKPKWSHHSAPPKLVYPLGYPDARVLNDVGAVARQALSAAEQWLATAGKGEGE